MYFYYMVAAMGPEYQKYIWWKKYLTTFQMVCALTVRTTDQTKWYGQWSLEACLLTPK